MTPTPTQVRQLQAGVQGLSTMATRDLTSLLAQVSTSAQAGQALNDVLPALIASYGQASSYLAATWYDQVRQKMDVSMRPFSAIPMPVHEAGTSELIGWALSVATSDDTLLALLSGGTQRRIADYSRGTVMGSSLEDPAAAGWKRVTDSSACDFCRMLAGRTGAGGQGVYSEATADFASHDFCGCMAVMDITGGTSKKVLLDDQGKRLTTSSRSSRTNDSRRLADNRAVRQWIQGQ